MSPKPYSPPHCNFIPGASKQIIQKASLEFDLSKLLLHVYTQLYNPLMCWDFQPDPDTTKVKLQGAALDCISLHSSDVICNL